MARVRVHDDDASRAATGAIGARAFTYGRDVFLGPGESAGDTRLMAHEMTHVIQQGAASERAQPQLTVGPVDSPAEREADDIAARVGRGDRPAQLIVDGPAVVAGQMDRAEFLAMLRSSVESAVDDALGPAWSVVGCPYVERWFERHATTPAGPLEKLAQRYSGLGAARSARDYLPPILNRLRAGIDRWKEGGELSQDLAAAGIDPGVASAPPSAAVAADDGQLQRWADPTSSAEPSGGELGPGEQLDATASSKLGGAMGESFGDVTVHTGPQAARKVSEAGAAAITAGSQIAFAPGEYRPGTPEGDAMLAHELAHVVQQRGAPAAQTKPSEPASQAQEEDADRAAAGAMATVYGAGRRFAANRVKPALTSPFRLQRCFSSKDPQKKAATEEHASGGSSSSSRSAAGVAEVAAADQARQTEAALVDTALPIGGGRLYQARVIARSSVAVVQIRLVGTREAMEVPLSFPAADLNSAQVQSTTIEQNSSKLVLSLLVGARQKTIWIQIAPSPYEAADSAGRPDRVRVFDGKGTVEKDIYPGGSRNQLSKQAADASTVVAMPPSGRSKQPASMVIELAPGDSGGGTDVTLKLQKTGQRRRYSLANPDLRGATARLVESAAGGTDSFGNQTHKVRFEVQSDAGGGASTIDISLISWNRTGPKEEGYTFELSAGGKKESGGFTVPATVHPQADFHVRHLDGGASAKETVSGNQEYNCRLETAGGKGIALQFRRASAEAKSFDVAIISAAAGEMKKLKVPYTETAFRPRKLQENVGDRGFVIVSLADNGEGDLMVSWDMTTQRGDFPEVSGASHIALKPMEATDIDLVIVGKGVPTTRATWFAPALPDNIVSPPKWERRQVGTRVGWFRLSDNQFIPDAIFYSQVRGAELTKTLFEQTAVAYVYTLPVAGQIVMIGEAIVGKQIITGRKMGKTERIIHGVLGAVFLLVDASLIAAESKAALNSQVTRVRATTGLSAEEAETLIRAAGKLSAEEKAFIQSLEKASKAGPLTKAQTQRLSGIVKSLEGKANTIRQSIKAASKKTGIETAPLESNTIVIDTNTAIALEKRAAGLPLQPGEQAMLKKIDALGAGELRVANVTVGELKAGDVVWRGLDISVKRSSKEYKKVLQVLERYGVGRTKGAADRAIVADTFFAEAKPGVTPTLATHDKGIYTPLVRIKGVDPGKLGKSVDQAFASGFEVTINGRTIKVIPLPRK